MSSPPASNSSASKNEYRYPPGLDTNLLWRALRHMGPPAPIPFFQSLAERYGDAAHYRLGRRHVLFLNSPEYIREVLIVQHGNFIKERTQQRAQLLLGQGMITAEGAAHRRQRQVAQPAFHRQKIPEYAAEIVGRSSELRERWQDGAQLNIYKEMMELTLDLVSRTLFSTQLGEEVVRLNAAMGDIMKVYNAIVLLPGIKLLLGIPGTPLRKFVHARARLDDAVKRMIAIHREAMERGDEHDDLLTMMLRSQEAMGWSEVEIRDQVITVFLAGYETVAIALTWTWYLLSEHADVQERLFAEIKDVVGDRLPTFGDVPKLRYAEMVLSESMRLYPPAWAMGRLALEDFELGPYRLPAGTTVLMSQYVTHRDARFFPDPLRFDPERFTPEAKAGRQRFTYFPFGMGPRQCIGEAFAWMEATLALVTLMQRWRVEHVASHKVEAEPLFTLRPKGGMPMHVHSR